MFQTTLWWPCVILAPLKSFKRPCGGWHCSPFAPWRYFKRRREIAESILVAGTGLGTALVSLLFQQLIPWVFTTFSFSCCLVFPIIIFTLSECESGNHCWLLSCDWCVLQNTKRVTVLVVSKYFLKNCSIFFYVERFTLPFINVFYKVWSMLR